MKTRNYAVFILSHGRADNVITYRILRKHGYTGKIHIVIDTEDEQGQRYIENFGKENVIVFDRIEEEKRTDTGDISGNRDTITFARNACFRIADELGYDYFIEADDDYYEFAYRIVEGTHLRTRHTHRLDDIFDAMFDFLDASGALSVAPAQGGDFIGGVNSTGIRNNPKRKCMNLFFCKTLKPVNFVSRLNEDVATYVRYGQMGYLFFTIAEWMLSQRDTQSQSGGSTGMYLYYGTYVKAFSSVMFNPSCVKIRTMGSNANNNKAHYRIHHVVDWRHCTPMIIDEKYAKGLSKGSMEAT